jgi:branched-chain amino acid transport system substrate-binding protein
MVDNDKITALLGSVLTDPTLAVVREAYPIGMPMITASATAAEVTYDNGTLYSNVFRTCFIDPFQGEKMAQYASEVLGATTAAVITKPATTTPKALRTRLSRRPNRSA